jgi:hypothetical protein
MVARPLTIGPACEGGRVSRCLKKSFLGLDNRWALCYYVTLSH